MTDNLHIHGYSISDPPPENVEQWNTDELRRDFEVTGFAGPFVLVTRRSDGVKGILEFTHSPRVYFNWSAD